MIMRGVKHFGRAGKKIAALLLAAVCTAALLSTPVHADTHREFEYDIDIMKLIYMLAIHELGETVIGDLTQFQIDKDEKEKIEHDAVHKILASLIDGEKIEALFLEFDSHETPEAKFAYQCDKLECDIQCKLYDQEQCVDLTHQEGNNTVNDGTVKELLETGKSWSQMWLEFGQSRYPYDKNFLSVSNYVKDNNI